jgi:hypothetical protein
MVAALNDPTKGEAMNTRNTNWNRKRLLRSAALALAVAGVAAPSAQAYYPAEGLGASAAPISSSIVRGENKADVGGSSATTVVVRGEDKVGFRQIGRDPIVSSPSKTRSVEWRDVGIGAAGGLALALLAASSLLAVRRSRRSGLATT